MSIIWTVAKQNVETYVHTHNTIVLLMRCLIKQIESWATKSLSAVMMASPFCLDYGWKTSMFQSPFEMSAGNILQKNKKNTTNCVIYLCICIWIIRIQLGGSKWQQFFSNISYLTPYSCGLLNRSSNTKPLNGLHQLFYWRLTDIICYLSSIQASFIYEYFDIRRFAHGKRITFEI